MFIDLISVRTCGDKMQYLYSIPYMEREPLTKINE